MDRISNTATIALGYFSGYVSSYPAKINLRRFSRLGRTGSSQLLPFQTEARIWYNPELKSSHFIILG